MFTNWTNTLGKKIGLYISILSILLFSILLFIITSYVKNITLDMNESLVKEQLNTITLEVNQFFTDSFLSIEQLAFNKDVETLLSEITDAENGIFHRNYGDVLDHLTRIKKKNSILSGTWVFDIDSKYMLNSYALDVDSSYNPQSQEWYIDIIDNQKPYSITAPYSDVITGNKIVSLALPVYKKDKIVGIAGADLFVYRITDTLKEKVLGTSGYVSLFTGEQEVIHYQDNENMFKQLSELNIDPLLLSYIESNDSAKMLSYKDHGTKLYGLTTKLPINGWIVLGSLPQNDISSTITPVITMLMFILIMGLIIIILATLFLTHRETKDFKLIRHYCNNLANGDFTFSIQPTLKKRRDELGSLANHFEGMKNNLAQLISQISTSSFAVDHSSGNLLHGLMDMSRSSHDLANNIGEVAVGATAQALEIQHGLEKTEELEVHLSHNKQCATSIKDSSKEVSTAIHEGNTILQDLIENTNHIVSSSQSINHLMKDIENQSKHIEEMNLLISNITEETNLLSLNASIEAARVGQAGLGFAVVAKEIRKLADQSAASTSNINTVVYDIKSLIKDAVGQVEHNTKIALLQLNYVEETQSKYKAITTAMEQVKKDIISLNHTGEDITSSKDTLREILETVAAVAEESASNTQESAASVEEQSATVQDLTIASQNLSDLATQLKEAIAQFNI